MGTSRRVFLSHTSEFAAYPERRSYVEAAQDACDLSGFVVGAMSSWTAADLLPAELCRRRVVECDVYIGLIGFSYGSPVRDEPDRSYTELEFEEARHQGLPVLIFRLAEDADMPPRLAVGDAKYIKRQGDFRRRLADELVVASFRNPDELGYRIRQSLRDLDALRHPSGTTTQVTAAPTPQEPLKTQPPPAVGGHAFISYVHEDSDSADQLEADLRASGIAVWRDVREIWPGDDWKRVIRQAIERDDCVFVVCLSQHSQARKKTYQWEEVTLAAQSFRLRPPDSNWIFPVRFDQSPYLDFDLGAGRNLADLQHTDLFGPKRVSNTARLVASIRRALA